MEEALKPWHSLPKITMARRMAGATAACACVLTGALFTSAYAALADRHCADGHLLQPPEQHASSGMLDSNEDHLLAVVGLQLLELLGEVLQSFDLLPRCQHHLLDVAREVALGLLRDGRQSGW